MFILYILFVVSCSTFISYILFVQANCSVFIIILIRADEDRLLGGARTSTRMQTHMMVERSKLYEGLISDKHSDLDRGLKEDTMKGEGGGSSCTRRGATPHGEIYHGPWWGKWAPLPPP